MSFNDTTKPGTNGHGADTAPVDTFGKEAELNREHYPSDDSASEHSNTQAGVKRIEGVSQAWTKTSLIVAYVTYETHSSRRATKLMTSTDSSSSPMSHLSRSRSRV